MTIMLYCFGKTTAAFHKGKTTMKAADAQRQRSSSILNKTEITVA